MLLNYFIPDLLDGVDLIIFSGPCNELSGLSDNLILYSLFLGHVSGGRVTDTDGDCIHYIYYSTVNISYGTSDPSLAYLHELFWRPPCVPVMK
jgi:hypothetical protein